MTLTKWDIIDANVSDRSMENDLQGIKDCMDEYAKQQSISFADWLHENYFMDDYGFYPYNDNHKKEYLPLSNLYEQFLTETNNKK